MNFTVPLSFLRDYVTQVTKSLTKKQELQHNKKTTPGENGCYDYVFNDYLMSIIIDKSGIIRCAIADIDLYGSNHNICIIKDDKSPVELKIFCCESDNDLDFTIFEEPEFFKIYREFYEQLIQNFLYTEDKSILKIPQKWFIQEHNKKALYKELFFHKILCRL